MISWLELKTQIRAIVFPDGEAENLLVAHDASLLDAMMDLQRWVVCLQRHNTDVHRFCTTYFECGRTIIDTAPKGRIKRVYTVVNEEWCDKVYFNQREYADVENWSRNLLTVTAPTNPTSLPALPQGYRYANASTDALCGRSRNGIWCNHRTRLYICPWIQSNESVVIEWEGLKRDWRDEDMVDDSPEVRRAMQQYLRMEVARDEECSDRMYLFYKAEYEQAKADLIYECREETKVRKSETPAATTGIPERAPTAAEIIDEEVPDVEEAETFFANIGDYGAGNDHEADVAALVISKNPSFVVTNGDNNYGDDYDENVGQYYSRFIYPYSGEFEGGAAENMFWPVPGNHDRDVDDALAAYLAFFSSLPGKQTYYSFVRGPVQFFMCDSTAEAEDGNGPSSDQAAWLKAGLAVSTARWKIVVIHDAPYTSTDEDAPGIISSRWDFTGADLVLSGDSHGYERLNVGGLDFIVNGAGGRSLNTFGTPIDGSQFIYAGYGAGFCRVSCDELVYEFFDVDGVLRDTLTIAK